MDSVMRFDPTYERGLPCMKMHPYGCYVDYQDYDQLQARVRELEFENEQLSSEVDNARGTMHGEIRYNIELRNRVKELEEQVAQIANDFEQTVKETKELFSTMITVRETIVEYVEVLMPAETWNEVQKFRGMR